MKLYYCENDTGEGIEEFYILDTGFGFVVELDSENSFTTYKSIQDFMDCWHGSFDKYAHLTRVS